MKAIEDRATHFVNCMGSLSAGPTECSYLHETCTLTRHKYNISFLQHGHRYMSFLQQLVCCTFLDPTHVINGVVVYSQSHL